MTMMFGEWILRAKSALLHFRRPPPQSDTYAIGVVRSSNKNSPIGKEVWLATEKKRIGVISHTFDDPSPVLPFPLAIGTTLASSWTTTYLDLSGRLIRCGVKGLYDGNITGYCAL